jgi:hypothetical protein
MKILSKRRQIIMAISVGIFAAPAHAIFGVGDIVLDPTNLVQTTASALAAVKNEINTAAAYITQMQQLVAMGKSLKSVSGLASLAGVEQELALYSQLKAVSTQLAAASGESLELSQRLHAAYGASSMSWQDFLKARASIDQGNAKGLAAQYATVTTAIERIALRRKEIVDRLQVADGQTSAMQSVGAGIDVLIGQNQQLMATLAAEGQSKLIQKNVDAATVQQGMRIISDRQQRLKDADAKLK